MRWTADQLLAAVDRLEEVTADRIESDTLELKGMPSGRAELKKWAVEAAVCFANQRGGTLLVGVADRTTGRARALVGTDGVSVTGLQRDVYDATDPHVLVEVAELSVPEGRLIAVHVPRGLPPHTTTAGLALIRIGNACVPLTGTALGGLVASSGDIDLSAIPIAGTGLNDVDPDALAEARRLLRRQPRLSGLADAPTAELLEALGLLDARRLNRAAVLLLAAGPTLARHLPQHEVTLLRYRRSTTYDMRQDLRGPLLLDLPRLEDFLSVTTRVRNVRPRGFQQLEIPSLDWEVAREAVLNAVAHRDYFLRQGVLLALRRDRVEVTSPGGFIGGISPLNVLRHPPVHRNELLARTLQQLGLVNRVGLGVDRIYEGLLRAGARPPVYTADHASVTLELPMPTNDELAAWIVEHERTHEALALDDLIVLRRLVDVGTLDRWTTAQELQLDEQGAADQLADMRRRQLVVAHGRGRASSYDLPRPLSERLRGRALTDADRPLEIAGVKARIVDLLRDRGRLTNAEIRTLSGYSRQQVLRVVKELEREHLVELRGHGRGAHIVPAG
jgi:ATP-dependent DNA helicase RecG